MYIYVVIYICIYTCACSARLWTARCLLRARERRAQGRRAHVRRFHRPIPIYTCIERRCAIFLIDV